MLQDEEINEKIKIFTKKIKKNIYTISTLNKKGLQNIKKILIKNVHR